MREIKFRQAIFTKGVFSHFHYWGFIDAQYVSPGTGNYMTIEDSKRNSNQFTGLKDKNGVEIYEGDIVRIPKYRHKFVIAEIEFVSSGTRFLYRAGYLGSSSWFGESRRDECVIIGNIYEHSHLLEGTDA